MVLYRTHWFRPRSNFSKIKKWKCKDIAVLHIFLSFITNYIIIAYLLISYSKIWKIISLPELCLFYIIAFLQNFIFLKRLQEPAVETSWTIENLNQNTARPWGSSMAEMAVQGLLEFWPCKSVNKLISGCLFPDRFCCCWQAAYLHGWMGR